jgi:hypothetical protein
VITTIRDEVRASRDDRAEQSDPATLLADTPLATQPGHQPVRTPLSLAEQVNVVAVMVVSQAIQVVFFTAGLFAFFLALGIVAVPYDVAVLWSAEEPAGSVNHHARERGSASTCRYPRPSCMCHCSWPCYPACTSP